ncbi:MAG: SDR family NAD(P)-dependent oxidoreductase [Chitinophagales bacterium]|nr:SDR family NAD(P)-dependent oxidoreductase [Chitinophagales bacterium]
MSFKEKYGPWALITGASSGLGVEYALQIAEKGLNVVLVARRIQLLEQLAEKIKNQYQVEVRTIELDLASEGFYSVLEQQTADLDIGLVVNNAGINCEGDFYRGDLNRNIQMLRLNVEAPFIIAYNMVKKLLERGKGGLIFTASSSAFQATPYLSHYGATKSYILSLAESMNYEFSGRNIDVIALCPGMTESEMTKGMKGSPIVMKAAPVVKLALDKIGKEAFVVPGLGNKIQVFMTQRILGRDIARVTTGALMKKVLLGGKKKK